MLTLIPALPFAGFLINAFFGRRLSKTVSGAVACLAMFAAFLVAASASWQLVQHPPEERILDELLFMWIPSGDFQLPLAFRLDPLSVVMTLVVTGIGFLIHLYSTSYMHEEIDSEYARYFSYLNLFAAFMLILVLGANFLVMFVGWEGVGLCSYLLIGFWFRKQSAADAGKKAFVVNRVGDFGFLLGMLLAFVTFGTLDFRAIAMHVAPMPNEVTFGVLSLMTLLLFVGATGKSAQIPLYVWLPDAMEGPTPVSALIHAATMVTAGVYMIGRSAELFAHAPITLGIVAVIGVVTALMAGTIGLVQNDIKRVLAYSTVSQLGYMFLAMGVGAFSAGIFHLYTHAFFKALMFLGSGAVIHALHGEQDMRHMGGLKSELPITYWTFLIGALAIAGIPPLAGFFSKDEILFSTFYSGHTLLWIVGLITAFLTAVYMFRLVFMTFHGSRHPSTSLPSTALGASRASATTSGHGTQSDSPAHGGHGHGDHLHDAPMPMAVPLVILALGSILAGFVGIPHGLGGSNQIETFLHPSFHPTAVHTEAGTLALSGVEGHADESKDSVERTLAVVSTLVAVSGVGLAVFFFLKDPQRAERLKQQFSSVHRLLLNKYYVDELYDMAIVQPIKHTSVLVWRIFDVVIIDGAVNGAGQVVQGASAVLRLVQTGSVRTYAASVFLGVLLILGFYLVR